MIGLSRNLLFFILLLLHAIIEANTTKLQVPRFVSIKANEVNARNAPNIKSPIEWVFVRKSEPVEIIAEYEQWRNIRDIKNEGGWVHLSVLSSKRYVIISAKDVVNLFSYKSETSKLVAKIAPLVRCQLKKCSGLWCKVTCKNHTGFIHRKFLWGVYKYEEI